MNKKSYANHIRWCDKNPRYKEILESTIKKLSHSSKQNYDVKCKVCGKEYVVNCTPHIYEKGKYKKTCSDKCAKILTALHTDNQERINSIKLAMEKYKKPLYPNVCKCCGKSFETADITKQFCSAKCYNQYKKYDSNLTVKDVYKNQCQFRFSLNEFPNEFDFQLIEKYGWYSASNRGNNLAGVSRDHRFSCDEGWNQKIDPYFISHPANCVLMQQSLNASKRNKCSITFDQLKDNVNKWNEKYGEYPNNIDYLYFTNYDIQFIN